jgi:hypothetical protein
MALLGSLAQSVEGIGSGMRQRARIGLFAGGGPWATPPLIAGM